MKVAVCVLFAALLPTQGRRPDERVILSVAAITPWTDTGLILHQGDRVRIRAWGTVQSARAGGARIGPGGTRAAAGGCKFVVVRSDVAAHSLVGNIAEGPTYDGSGFYVGPEWVGEVPVAGARLAEGHLILGFNDAAMACDRSGYDSWEFRHENSGVFTAEVTITRARSQKNDR
jgi:hypothetical protein